MSLSCVKQQDQTRQYLFENAYRSPGVSVSPYEKCGTKYPCHTVRVVLALRVGLCQAVSASTDVQSPHGFAAGAGPRPRRLARRAPPSRLLRFLPWVGTAGGKHRRKRGREEEMGADAFLSPACTPIRGTSGHVGPAPVHRSGLSWVHSGVTVWPLAPSGFGVGVASCRRQSPVRQPPVWFPWL